MTRLRLAILVSGRGSNMQALLDAAQADGYPARPTLVLSNRPDALALDLAAKHGIATCAVDHKVYGKDREAFEREMDKALKQADIEVIALAGFMRVLTPWFVREWSGRMINIHPSLLPKYPGLNTHQRAIDAGDTYAGCSVHWVTESVDEGAIIDQAEVAIAADETAVSLAKKILPIEHTLYPRALAKACTEIIV